MKKQAYMTAIMILLVAMIGLSSAKAQTVSNQQLIANIPFEFSVGGKTLPAGEYTVRCTNPASDQKVLQLTSKDGHASVLVQTNSVIGKTNERAKLVFNRYGDRYFFSQAWLAADNTGTQAPKSRNERATEKELTSVKRSTERVALTRQR